MPSSNTSTEREAARREIHRLTELLARYQREYYVLARPSVGDLEYDRLFDRLHELEARHPELRRPDSPTQRVGSDLSQELPEVAHSVPVLSLDKVYTAAELSSWMDKTERNAAREPAAAERPAGRLSFIVEEKIDGASIVLYYREGLLERAVTRGNGLVGNDVTGNVRTIRAVPLRLARPATVAVRGEIFLSRRLFQAINERMDNAYANPRNLAAGTLRRVKSREVAAVPLSILCYEGSFPEEPLGTHREVLEELARLGFKLNPHTGLFAAGGKLEEARRAHPEWEVGELEELPGYLERARRSREERDYEIDGMVVKVNELPAREVLGFTGHHPRWAMAFKFEAPEAVSTVERIEVQVGRTGRLTPVARIRPVRLSGSTVSRATLHNQDYVDLLELAVGDQVSVSKRGDVIPAVERVIEKNEQDNSTWRMPSACPACSRPLVKVGAHHFCPNSQCPDQVRGRIRFFAGRNQMDIESLGPETVDLLIQRSLVRDPGDLYRLTREDLLSLPGFAEKKAELVLSGIRASRGRPFRRVLLSLGIPEIGQKAVELLLDAGCRDIDSLLSLAERGEPEPLTAIHGIGEKTARTLLTELARPELRALIESLRGAGLAMREAGPAPPARRGPLSGQSWCVTGSFRHFQPRERAVEEVKKRGGRVVSGVSARTTHLLAGSGAGAKLEKARELGVRIVSEEELLKMLRER